MKLAAVCLVLAVATCPGLLTALVAVVGSAVRCRAREGGDT